MAYGSIPSTYRVTKKSTFARHILAPSLKSFGCFAKQSEHGELSACDVKASTTFADSGEAARLWHRLSKTSSAICIVWMTVQRYRISDTVCMERSHHPKFGRIRTAEPTGHFISALPGKYLYVSGLIACLVSLNESNGRLVRSSKQTLILKTP